MFHEDKQESPNDVTSQKSFIVPNNASKSAWDFPNEHNLEIEWSDDDENGSSLQIPSSSLQHPSHPLQHWYSSIEANPKLQKRIKWGAAGLIILLSLAMIMSLILIPPKPVQPDPLIQRTPSINAQELMYNYSMHIIGNNIYSIVLHYMNNNQPYKGILQEFNLKDGSLKWHSDVSLTNAPAFAQDMIYLPTASGLIVLREKDKSVVWKSPLGNRIWYLGKDSLLTDQDNGKGYTQLNLLRRSDGQILWSTPDQNTFWIGIRQGIAYFRHAQTLIALSLTDGQIRWQKQEDQLSTDNSYIGFIAGDKIIESKNVGGETLDTQLIAFSTQDGTQSWSSLSEQQINYYGTDTIQNNAIYLISPPPKNQINGTIHAINIENGEELWTYPLSNSDLSPSITTLNNIVYIQEDSNLEGKQITALNQQDGKLLWQVKHFYALALLPQGNTLLLDAMEPSANLRLQNANGQTLWKESYPLSEVGTDGVLTFNNYDTAYIITQRSGSGRLLAINLNNGRQLWKSQRTDISRVIDQNSQFSYAASFIEYDPQISDVKDKLPEDMVFTLSASSGQLIALKARDGSEVWHHTLE